MILVKTHRKWYYFKHTPLLIKYFNEYIPRR